MTSLEGHSSCPVGSAFASRQGETAAGKHNALKHTGGLYSTLAFVTGAAPIQKLHLGSGLECRDHTSVA